MANRYVVCLGLVALGLLGNQALSASDRPVPVMIGGMAQEDACGSNGEVSGLNPAGENFLAVRSGPGIGHALLDRLPPGARVYICEESAGGSWLGIVYPEGDCGVSSPVPVRKPYGGPCRSGWVSGKYVSRLAG